jgi:hypothetical protein
MSPTLFYAVLTAIIVFTVTQLLSPIIMCFLKPIKRLFCGCCMEQPPEPTPTHIQQEEITEKDVIKANTP